MTGIPLTIELDRETWAKLEVIARKRRTPMRHLVAQHIKAGLEPRVLKRTTLTDAQRGDIVTLIRGGMTTEQLARHFDTTTKQIVIWRARCREAGLIE